MAFISFTINENLTTNFPIIRNKIRSNIYEALQKINIKLTNHIKSTKLTGTVLKVQTGRLRNSIRGKVVDNGNIASAEASTNLEYAAIHEYGFKGNESVRAHTRNIKQAFGKSINPMSINISAHNRLMNMPKRSFMMSSLLDLKDEMQRDILVAVRKSL